MISSLQRRAIITHDRFSRLQQTAQEGGEDCESTRSGEGEEEGRGGGREEGEAESGEGGREGEEGGGEGSGSLRGDGSHSSLGTDSVSGIIPEEGTVTTSDHLESPSSYHCCRTLTPSHTTAPGTSLSASSPASHSF